MQDTLQNQPRRRPLGVTIIAVLEAIQGIILLLLGLLGLLLLAAVTQNRTAEAGAGTLVTVLGVVLLLLGIPSLIFAWGLWTLKRWAFWLTVVLQAINVIVGLFQLLQPGSNGVSNAIGSMIIPLIILLYFLVDKNVRAAFRT